MWTRILRPASRLHIKSIAKPFCMFLWIFCTLCGGIGMQLPNKPKKKPAFSGPYLEGSWKCPEFLENFSNFKIFLKIH